jgi:hypothetical protein
MPILASFFPEVPAKEAGVTVSVTGRAGWPRSTTTVRGTPA